MANRTVKEAKNIHGTNPQYLIEKIIRSRIYDCKYWKEQCFALTAELLVDKAMELRFVGGVYGGNIKPTQFMCLTLKMLQIQPEKDIVVEFIKNEEFKYVRALGAFYLRLTGSSLDCYKYLEPLYIDNRKLRRQNRAGQFEIVYMDEFIDELLRSDRVCDIILPRVQKRTVLEENNELEPKVSPLDDDLDEVASDDEDKLETVDITSGNSRKKSRKERSRSRSRSRSISPAQERNKRNYQEELRNYERRRDDGGRRDEDQYRRREELGQGRDRERERDRDYDRHHREKDYREQREAPYRGEREREFKRDDRARDRGGGGDRMDRDRRRY